MVSAHPPQPIPRSRERQRRDQRRHNAEAGRGQPEREPAEPGEHKTAAGAAGTSGVATAHHERVDEQAQPAEQQHLYQRLAQQCPRRVHLGEAHREHQFSRYRPPRPAQPSREPGERQHGAAAEDRGHQQRPAEAAEPRSAGEHQRQPRQELRSDHAPGHGVARSREVQPACPAERGGRLRDPHRPVPGDPVPVLQVDAGVADREDLLGAGDRLPHPESGRDQHHREQRAGRHAARLIRCSEPRPSHRQPPHREVAERDRERHEDDRHWQRQQPSRQQHADRRHQPRHREQRRRLRHRGEGPPGVPGA